MKAYPIKFRPILKDKVWGGEKLKTRFNKSTNSNRVGESWEISGVKDNVSEAVNGIYKGMSLSEIQSKFKSDFIGAENYNRFKNEFPLLIKYLDAKSDLSIQVHPDDRMAKKYHGGYGKTEMWYVMDHEQDAEIILGLKDKNQENKIPQHITLNNIADVFEKEKVQKGDVYFIPAGKVHAIGAGVMVAEIQQTSDITYRIYDWDREDTCGNKRELHTDLARQATKDLMDIPKKEYSSVVNEAKNVVHNQYFTTNVLDVCNHFKQDLEGVDSFVIYMCVEGRVSITVDNHTEILETGETILLPASSSDAIFYTSKAKLLEVFLDPMASEYQAKAA